VTYVRVDFQNVERATDDTGDESTAKKHDEAEHDDTLRVCGRGTTTNTVAAPAQRPLLRKRHSH
jgi:hypothetical protein